MLKNTRFAAATCCIAAVQGHESLSLLQTQAQKRIVNEDLESEMWAGQDSWSLRYNKCRDAPQGMVSGCAHMETNKNEKKTVQAAIDENPNYLKSARFCAILAKKFDATGFNFVANKVCEPLNCDTSWMRYVQPGQYGNETWEVYSETCGLVRSTRNEKTDDCGWQHESFLVYRVPKADVCWNALNFTGGYSGSLGDPAGLRLNNVMDSTDMIIKAGENYAASKRFKGRYQRKGFTFLNLAKNLTTNFNFQLVESGTENPKIVPWFSFSIIDVISMKDCDRNVYVNASNFFSYHLEKSPYMRVKADLTPTRQPSVLFGGIIAPDMKKDKFTGKMSMQQRKRSFTLVFKDTASFNLEITVTDGTKGGRSLRLGHELLTDCIDVQKNAEREKRRETDDVGKIKEEKGDENKKSKDSKKSQDDNKKKPDAKKRLEKKDI